jgi:hypothetical protein
MPEEGLGWLVEDGETVVRRAWVAENVPATPGSDPSGSVTVTLDGQGRVSSVKVSADWRRAGVEDFPGAALQDRSPCSTPPPRTGSGLCAQLATAEGFAQQIQDHIEIPNR